MMIVEKLKVVHKDNETDNDVIEVISDSKEELIKTLENEIKVKNTEIDSLKNTNRELTEQISMQNHRIKSLANELNHGLNELTISKFK